MPGDAKAVDLRSDTVTRPTAAMRRAMAEAEVGDDVLGDDPTVRELERMVAELLGKERALFFPSGIMANQTAILALTTPGTEVVADARSHILHYEEGAAAAWAGVQIIPAEADEEGMTARALLDAIRADSPYLPRTSLLCLENTRNSAGGRVLPLERMMVLASIARERGLSVHLDGARLVNAAAACGLPMRAWAEKADTVMISLSKGLGAPVGSMLAGSEEVIIRSWRIRRRLGGGMRQSGILAAAAIHALQHHVERIQDDHRRARDLADLADTIPGVEASRPETNIVLFELDPRLPDAEAVVQTLAARGVEMDALGPRTIRAVTHLDVDDGDIARAGSALRDVAAELGGLAHKGGVS